MKPILVVENVCKKYSRKADRHLNYGIADLWSEVMGRNRGTELRPDEFLAVNDASFHLAPGDTFALVGRNGSGKTTLLKMLAGLIKPDGGTIMIDGRVQAIINLGAGFNPALSGRENIFIAAALMGLGRRQTTEILDAVIDFSELEESIDSPFGTYSSGMKGRLAFAVAINLRPDILLIDEVLSVGDFAFQNKCFRRMQELKKDGVSIVLVSHSHNSVVQLCERALWLHNGKGMRIGPAKDVVQEYLGFLEDHEVRRLEQKKLSEEEKRKREQADRRELERKRAERPRTAADGPRDCDSIYGPIFSDNDMIEDLTAQLLVNGESTTRLRVHDSVVVRYKFRLLKRVDDLNITLKFFLKDGTNLTTISTLNGDVVRHIHEGLVEAEVRIPDFDFNPNAYTLVIAIHEGKSYLYRNVVQEFSVTSNGRLTWGLKDFQYEYKVLS
jgi:ABC-type polysaccharide/polyol phosphate transport system ATPase subunit